MSNEQEVCLAKQLVMGSQSPERLRRFWHKVIFHIQISNICTLTGWKAHALLSRSSVMLDTVMSDTASSHGNANLQVFFFFQNLSCISVSYSRYLNVIISRFKIRYTVTVKIIDNTRGCTCDELINTEFLAL